MTARPNGHGVRGAAMLAMLVAMLGACGTRSGPANGAAGENGPGAGAPPPGGVLPADPAGDPLGWPKTFETRVFSLASGARGRVFVASGGVRFEDPLVLSAYEADGTLVWERRWTGARARPVHRRGLAATPDGGLVVGFGAACDPGASGSCDHPIDLGGTLVPRAAVVRLAADGSVAWWLEAPAGRDGIALASAADGRVAAADRGALVVLGVDGTPELTVRTDHRFEPAFGPDGALYVTKLAAGDERRLVKLDREGRALWEAHTQAVEAQIAASPDGATVAVGIGGAVELHDAASGALLSTLPLPVCCSLAVDRDGAIVLAGKDRSSGARAVAKLAPSGEILADRILGPPAEGPIESALALGGDGAVLLAGAPWRHAVPGAAVLPEGSSFVLALGPGLEADFGATGPTPAPEVAARSVASGAGARIPVLDPRGSFEAERIRSGGDDAIELRSVDATGAVRWTRRFHGFFERSTARLAAAPDGGVVLTVRYVCGIAKSSCDRVAPDFGGGPVRRDGVVKLGPDGAFQWQVDVPRLDEASLALGPGGEIAFVSDGELWVLEPGGALRWTFGAPGPDFDGRVSGSPAFDAHGNVAAARVDGRLVGASRITSWSSDGRVRWSGPVVERYSAFATLFEGRLEAKVLADGTIVASWAVDERLSFLAVDPVVGIERWRASLDVWPSGGAVTLVPADGGLIVVGRERAPCHEIRAVRLAADGRVLAARNLTAHGFCVGAASFQAAALAPDGALWIAGVTTTATDVGGAIVPPRTRFVASVPPP